MTELESLKIEVSQLLQDMEYHHMVDSEEPFDTWWRAEGREQKYFALRERLDRMEAMQNIPESSWFFNKSQMS